VSWLSEILAPRRTSRLAELEARVEHYAARAESEAATARAALSGQRRLAVDLDNREQRLAQQARVIADLRAELDRANRRADRLQQQYDSAVGLDSPALDDGARWQQRREDKKAVTS
jgi:predicted  nucleic acid-binding Zn-ribbon protein